MISHIEETALQLFNSENNCSQAVLVAYADYLNFDKELALNISCGFGGGMGKMQNTCGAVTGAYMVLGIYNSRNLDDTLNCKERTYKTVQDFNDKFLKRHASTDCKTLTNCNLLTPEGQEQFKILNIKKTVCENCIKDSIAILNNVMGFSQQ